MQCYDDYAVNWTWAENYCNDYYNGHLGSFASNTELSAYLTMRDSTLWTHGAQWFGYNAINKNTSDASEWEYTDGLVTNFTNWTIGDPSDNTARCGMYDPCNLENT